MDIVVTISKARYEHNTKVLRDFLEKGGSVFWWFFRKPKDCDIGDRVHFVKNGRIEYSMRIFAIKPYGTEKCELTGKTHTANYFIFMDDLQYHTEIIEARGFQGFRYKWWKDGDENG